MAKGPREPWQPRLTLQTPQSQLLIGLGFLPVFLMFSSCSLLGPPWDEALWKPWTESGDKSGYLSNLITVVPECVWFNI